MISEYIRSYKTKQNSTDNNQHNQSNNNLNIFLNKVLKNIQGRIKITSKVWLVRANDTDKHKTIKAKQQDKITKKSIDTIQRNIGHKLRIGILNSVNNQILMQAFIKWFISFLLEVGSGNHEKLEFINTMLNDRRTQCIYIQNKANESFFAIAHNEGEETIVIKTVFQLRKRTQDETEVNINFHTTIEAFNNSQVQTYDQLDEQYNDDNNDLYTALSITPYTATDTDMQYNTDTNT